MKLTAASTIAAGMAGQHAWGDDAKSGSMVYRPLGSTGVKVSALGLGGYHIGNPADESEGIKLIRSAVDRGVTFMDNSCDYHNGDSEVRMGKALRDGYRDKVFLMTKIDGRSKAGAEKQMNESLARLQTDHLDLLQFHEIIRMDDAERIFAPGGAIEAALAAQKAGKIRFIGFTGHKDPSIHLHMLDVAAKHDFHFDAVQMPLNVMDAHFRSFEKQVLPVLVREKIGVLGMKCMGFGDILRSGAVTPAECLRYALNLPTSVVITGMERMEYLDQAIATTTSFQPMSEAEVAALLAKTVEFAKDGTYEMFKTTSRFDATASQPDLLN
jgi:aryl-alcohol dehydrogenase-like predicted oxidoreductase